MFEETGTFTLYYEHAGEFTTRLDGSEQDITLAGPETPPEFDVRLLDQNGEEVRLRQDVPDVSYDASGFKGTAYRQVSIDDVGRFTLEIVPDADSSAFALAVGKGTVSEPSAVLPAVIGLVGLGLGLLVILISASRRKRAMQLAARSAEPVPPPGYAVPTAPPAFAVPAPAGLVGATSGRRAVACAAAPPSSDGRVLPPPPLPRDEVDPPRNAPTSPWGPPGS